MPSCCICSAACFCSWEENQAVSITSRASATRCRQHSVQGLLQSPGRPGVPVGSGQAEKNEVHHAIVDDVVAFIVQLAVDVGQNPADGFHGKGGFQHVDDDDAAELAAVVLFLHRRG